MRLLSAYPESKTTVELWRRLGASALDTESLDVFLSDWHQRDEDTLAICMQRVALAALSAASAGEAADARFLRRLLKVQGREANARAEPASLLHLKAGSVPRP